MNCPICITGELEHRATPTQETHVKGFNVHQQGERETHGYVCNECPFVGLEWHDDKDTEAFKRLIN